MYCNCFVTQSVFSIRSVVGAIPDQYTERVLVQAFSVQPSLAAEVLEEARQVQLAHAVSRKAGAPGSAPLRSDHAENRDHGDTTAPASSALSSDGNIATTPVPRQPPLSVERRGPRSLSPLLLPNTRSSAGTIPPEELLYIDLHGMSQAAATTLLHRRLELLVAAWPELKARYGFRGFGKSEELDSETEVDTPTVASFQIVTGKGHGSFGAQGVLRSLTRETLSSYGLEVTDVPGNPGVWPMVSSSRRICLHSHWRLRYSGMVFQHPLH